MLFFPCSVGGGNGGIGGGTPSDLLSIIDSASMLLNIVCITNDGIFLFFKSLSILFKLLVSLDDIMAWPLILICITGGLDDNEKLKGAITELPFSKGVETGIDKFI